MDRDSAFSLANAVANARYSCGVVIDVIPQDRGEYEEDCCVTLTSTNFGDEHLTALIAIGRKHDSHLHLIDGGLVFLDVNGDDG